MEESTSGEYFSASSGVDRTSTSESSTSGPNPYSSTSISGFGDLPPSSTFQGLYLEILSECSAPKLRLKFSTFLLRFPALLSFSLVLILYVNSVGADRWLKILLILSTVNSVGLWSEFGLIELVSDRNLWNFYQLLKGLIAENIVLLTLSAAICVISTLPLMDLTHEGLLSNSTNLIYLLISMSSVVEVFLITFALLKTYQTYKVLHIYKVAQLLRLLTFQQLKPVVELSRKPAKPYHREILVENLAHKSGVYKHLRFYYVSVLIIELLALGQIVCLALFVQLLYTGTFYFKLTISASLVCSCCTFMSQLSPISTRVAVILRNQLKSRLWLSSFAFLAQLLLICLVSVYLGLKWDSVLNYPRLIAVNLSGAVVLVFLMAQIDGFRYLTKTINHDLYVHYTSSTSDTVSF